MTIHGEHPFADPPHVRRDLRRVRGRWPSGVSVWTSSAGTMASRHRAVGLTVSSLMFADGEPGQIVGLLDPASELCDAIATAPEIMINILSSDDASLAEVFAGRSPAPGGPFTVGEWIDHAAGPRLATAVVAVAVRILSTTSSIGWSDLVRGEVTEVWWGEDRPVLAHVRGRYRTELG